MPVSDYVRKIRDKIGDDLLMMAGAAAIIRDAQGRFLMQHRTDNDLWGIPGGMVEPGEHPAEAVIREVFEETGLQVNPVSIVGVYAGPNLMGIYPNGNAYAYMSVTFLCEVVGGALSIDDDETQDLQWFSPDDIPANHVKGHVERIYHVVNGQTPYFFKP